MLMGHHIVIMIMIITLALTSCSEPDLPNMPSIGNGKVMQIKGPGDNFDFQYSVDGKLSYIWNYGAAVGNEVWYEYDAGCLKSIATKSTAGSYMNATFNYNSGQLMKVLGTANLSWEGANDTLTAHMQNKNGKIMTQIDSTFLYNPDPTAEVFKFIYDSRGNLTSLNSDLIFEYDDKINPFHNYYFLLFGIYPTWINRSNFSLITSPNNLVKIQYLPGSQTVEIKYEYVDDYPVSAIITSSNNTSEYTFIYQELD
jgi:hypothetical protein